MIEPEFPEETSDGNDHLRKFSTPDLLILINS